MTVNAPNIVWIINPIAGKGKAVPVLRNLLQNHPLNKSSTILIWQKADELEKLISHAIELKPDAIVAAGGDGTINQIARKLIGNEIPLGIIPFGSGNGLARELGIPLNPAEAIKLISNLKVSRIDAGKINEHWFFCTAGTGLDAQVALRFANSPKRGFLNYLRITFQEFLKAHPETITIRNEKNEITIQPLLLTIANARQFGNNTYIAPLAKMNDSKLNLVWINKSNLFNMMGLIPSLFNLKLHKHSQVGHLEVNSCTIIRASEGPVHFDGEPAMAGKELEIKCYPLALKVIVGSIN